MYNIKKQEKKRSHRSYGISDLASSTEISGLNSPSDESFSNRKKGIEDVIWLSKKKNNGLLMIPSIPDGKYIRSYFIDDKYNIPIFTKFLFSIFHKFFLIIFSVFIYFFFIIFYQIEYLNINMII